MVEYLSQRITRIRTSAITGGTDVDQVLEHACDAPHYR